MSEARFKCISNADFSDEKIWSLQSNERKNHQFQIALIVFSKSYQKSELWKANKQGIF